MVTAYPDSDFFFPFPNSPKDEIRADNREELVRKLVNRTSMKEKLQGVVIRDRTQVPEYAGAQFKERYSPRRPELPDDPVPYMLLPDAGII